MDRRIVALLAGLAAPALAQTLPYELPQDMPPAASPNAPPPASPAPDNPFLHDETKADAEARAAKLFAAMDVDHKGTLTPDAIIAYFQARVPKERAAAVPAMVREMIEDADADHDGRISAEESRAAAARGFDEADTNHDGVVTPAERMAAMQDVAADKPKAKAKPAEVGR